MPEVGEIRSITKGFNGSLGLLSASILFSLDDCD